MKWRIMSFYTQDVGYLVKEKHSRGEGVDIVLSHDQVATKAWRESSEEYGYRIITTRLKISSTKHLFIIFSYACFYTDLQSVLDGVPEGDLLIVLADWNARADSNIDGMWDDVRWQAWVREG